MVSCVYYVIQRQCNYTYFNMKFLLFGAYLCVLAAQICLGEDPVALSLDCSLRTLTDEQNERNHGYFDAIKGISSQASEDFKSLKQEHCAFLYSVKDFVYESLLKELNGRDAVVKPDDAYIYLQRWGFRQNDMAKILQKANEIPSDSLNAKRKARLTTFLKGIQNEATLDEIKAAFAYLYGSA